jgi:hypothetical protein
MQHYSFLDDVTLDSLRIDHSPRDGLTLVHMCFYALLRGESGATYNIMRALPHPEKTSSMNFGAYRGTDELEGTGSLLFPFREHPAVEPFWSAYSPDSVIYGGRSFRYELSHAGYQWQDANGKIEVQAARLGQGYSFYVPRQDGFPSPIVLQDFMAKMTGTLDGDPVEGIFHDSHIYGFSDLTFEQLNFTSRLENYWMDWLVEYDDGTLEGGFAMRGQPGADYTIAHHVVNDASIARSDARFEVSRSAQGTMSQVRLTLGDDLTVICDQHGSFDWPLHTYGTVSSITRPKKVVKSWNYTENWPRNWGHVQRYQIAYADLYGRYPSLKRILESSRVVDEKLVFAEPE